MKKILKYSIFIIILFLSFNTDALGVTTKKKDFCKENQKYIYTCDQVKMQCNYKDKNGKMAYINITHSGSAKGYAAEKVFSSEFENWGQASDEFEDWKQIYVKTNQCPTYFLVRKGSFFLKYFYVTNSVNYTEKDLVYELDSVTINTYDPIKESEKKDEESEYPDVDNCAGFKTEEKCKVGITAKNGNYGCVWNDDYTDLNDKGKGFCSPSGLLYLSCGSGDSIAYDIPVMVPRLTSYAITALKTVTPVILIIMGMFQLIKSITSQNEDEMKKAKSSLVKKVIASVIIFFMVSIVQFVVSKVADTKEQESLSSCLSCFLNNDCGKNYYYTDGYGNCYNISNNKKREHCPVEHY